VLKAVVTTRESSTNMNDATDVSASSQALVARPLRSFMELSSFSRVPWSDVQRTGARFSLRP
jgi:hypothetical protein